MDRIATIRSLFATHGHGLEIGPSYNPLFPKAAGFDIETVDHASADELRAKYANEPGIDCNRIEDVDYVWDGRPLTEIVGKLGCYDYIAASHVIEHTTDLLGFLKHCTSLLAPEGVLFLAVPDKRRCFDVFRPLSTTGAVLQAHAEQRSRHGAAVAFDHVAYFANLDGAGGWTQNRRGELATMHDLAFARHIFERSLTSNEYHDFHAWTFCPSSFRLICKELDEIGALGLREARFMTTPDIEFFVTLSRSGEGCALTRAALLRQIQQELAEFPTSADVPIDPEEGHGGRPANATNAVLQEAEAARQALRAAQSRIAALEASTSWRMTAPLRAILQAIRGA